MSAQAPTEFAPYWDAIERPGVKRARGACRRLLGFDLVPCEETVREFARGYYDADPTAEAFVDEVYLGRSVNEGRRMLDRAIAGGVQAVRDASPSMIRLFAESERDPEWLDPDRLAIGARVFRRLGPSAFSLAGASTLLAYTENSIVKPLALTGAYAGDTALNRFMETARFWIDTTEPGGLEPGGQGRATAIRVRIMHVFVRRRLLGHPEWNLDGWGVRKRLRDEVNYRAQLGYTRFFLPGRFYRRYDMPSPWPWALHPLAQFPANFAASTLARHSSGVGGALDRYQRWRRERWWRNEMGDRRSHFQAAETFRR